MPDNSIEESIFNLPALIKVALEVSEKLKIVLQNRKSRRYIEKFSILIFEK
jgi:hypothetical protein